MYAMFAAGGPSIGASELAVAPSPTIPIPTVAPTAELAALQAAPPQTLVSDYASSSTEPLEGSNQDTLSVLQQRLSALGLEPELPTGVTSSAAATATATATATPESRADQCEPHSSGLYCIYTVQPGDTLSAIAADFGLKGGEDVTPAAMLAESNKPDVVDSDEITVGFKLRIPVENGLIHTVFHAETLTDVADMYGVTADSIQAVGVNQIDDANALTVGQEILVPDPQQITNPAPPADDAAVVEDTATPVPEDTATPAPRRHRDTGPGGHGNPRAAGHRHAGAGSDRHARGD